ncbi:hypothetical protein M9H77_26874 [Catharanthus roseus]|uniref:Uncharacterized protein n=1 Tax=Catharanthus roseus TaxID=4058 RepID=A0ACC0AEZ5_CATRO|nr:hypothetical protein M9H77_26874 [Catharanthus roseus]
MYISPQGIEKEESMKPLLLEKSLMVNELLQARIEIEESVEMYIEGEISREDFGDSTSDMSFEEEENIEFERKDRVEENDVKKMRALKKKGMILRKMREQKRLVKKNKRIQKKSWIISESQVVSPTCLHHNINERKEKPWSSKAKAKNFAKAFVKNQ